MKLLAQLPVALALASPVLAGLIPTPNQMVAAADRLLHPPPSYLDVQTDYYDNRVGRTRKLCTLHATPEGEDDTDRFESAVQWCGQGGILRLPSEIYNITRPLVIRLEDATLDLHGWLSFDSQDIDFWIENRIPFEFQNQALAFVIEGDNFVLEGNDVGGINGNGQAWYNYAKDFGNKYGRPMSLAIRNSNNVVVKNWSIIQPQFWAHISINSTNVLYRDCYVNATSYNPESSVDPKNWLQNTDGLDTYQSRNVTVENWVYQGGDDCIALKPNSTDITLRNVSCYGGTGIAFGSIGQYEGVTDIIENVYMEDLKLYPSSQCPGYQGVYWKSWMGTSFGIPPNGGGGGTGWCRNVTVRDVYMQDIWHPIAVSSGLTYLESEHGKHQDTGTFEWSDIHLSNFTGNALENRVVWMDCSRAAPCHGWTFENIDIVPGKEDHPEIHYVCNNFVLGGTDGLDQCHPNNSTLETETGGTM